MSLETSKEYKDGYSHKSDNRSDSGHSTNKSRNHGRKHSHYGYHSRSHRSKLSSSDMERQGINSIYKKVRRNRISEMIQRVIFIISFVLIIIFVVYAIATSEGGNNRIFTINSGKNDISEKYEALKDKVEELETYIEELEERLSEYEPINSEEVFDY